MSIINVHIRSLNNYISIFDKDWLSAGVHKNTDQFFQFPKL